MSRIQVIRRVLLASVAAIGMTSTAFAHYGSMPANANPQGNGMTPTMIICTNPYTCSGASTSASNN
jgi:hypothetical protein